ncbi:MAG: ATP-binding protein [Candidatus Moraniibacteriota bacterium]|nr:MAG: ATP-binding protein [Candidatus Moranbacteria bacterium]
MTKVSENLESNIVGRVARYPLAANENNSLIPLFEAIHNSIHAIQDLHGDNAPSKGRIEISIVRHDDEDAAIKGFTILDNGVGLNVDNYKAFRTPDSLHKFERGGKGIGRLGWLKVFENISIRSGYEHDKQKYFRSFDFLLTEDGQISNIVHGLSNGQQPAQGTEIQLVGFTSNFSGKCPKEFDKVAKKIVAHFIPLFASKAAPSMLLIDGAESEDLRDFFEKHIVEQIDQDFEIKTSSEKADDVDEDELEEDDEVENKSELQEPIKLQIKHLKCHKSIRPKGGKGKGSYNWLFLCAHDRSVVEIPLDQALGLKTLDDEYIYIGCVSGDYLNEHVNQERTAFTFVADVQKAINGAAVKNLKDHLSSYIQEIKEIKKVVARSIIDKNPQFLFLKGEIDQFIDGIKNNANEEEIKLEMFRRRMRRNKQFSHVNAEIKKSKDFSEEIKQKVDSYKGFLEEEKKGALAEYVLKRKSVLELLDRLLGYNQEQDEEKHYLENAVHSLICPMKKDAHDLEFEDHNLWIVDDRLAFFDYFTSDKRYKDFVDVDSEDRPDLSFFYNSCFAWRRPSDHTDSIVIVEFKRPGRDDYQRGDKHKDPIMQACSYIENFKSGNTIKDKSGKVISGITEGTTFHCFIVADLTKSLMTTLQGMSYHHTPDKAGLVIHSQHPQALIEVISYEKLLKDASTRNAVFFEKLGLLQG